MPRNKLGTIDYKPPYLSVEEPSLRDPEMGLPEIHKVSGAQTKDKATSYMRENAMQSLGLTDKIDMSLGANNVGRNAENEITSMLGEMVRVASSGTRFDSPTEFQEYLTEGVILNVNKLISRAINVPQGEYLVYNIDPKKAMLVPTAELSVQETDFTAQPNFFEIHTGRLYGCWDKAERTISEEQPPQFSAGKHQGEKNLKRVGKREKIQDVSKGVYGNMKYPRDRSFRGEREAHDLSLDDIVGALGNDVDKSTVSRWGAQAGTPSSRMPSGEHIIKLAKIGIDPDTFTSKAEAPTTSGTPSRGGGQVGS